CSGLEQALRLGLQPVDARRQDSLHSRWYLQALEGVRMTIDTSLPGQDSGLHQRPHALLQEKGVALRPHNQHWLERCQTGVVSQQALEPLISPRGCQRIEPQLRVRRFLKKNILIQEVGAGLIKMSYLGNAGWRSNRFSTACIAAFPSAMPFW